MAAVNSLNDRLLFAVPKKGRLNSQTLELLKGSDIQFHRSERSDIALVKNLPLALVFLPAADIPTFVDQGKIDLGITGRDQVAEHEAVKPPTETTGKFEGNPNAPEHDRATFLAQNMGSLPRDLADQILNSGVQEVMDLGFGMCKLQVQVPEHGEIQTPEQLVGRSVVTSFTNLAGSYFRGLESKSAASQTNGDSGSKLRTTITYVGGSVEAACALGVADGIVDLVESGATMRAAGLKAIDTVVDSTAVLIASKRPSDPKLVNLIEARIQGVITAQKYVLCTYNAPRTLLPKCRQITPGRRAPTVNGLDDEGWVAVQAMVERGKIATVMDELTDVGATDIMVTKLENTRMM